MLCRLKKGGKMKKLKIIITLMLLGVLIVPAAADAALRTDKQIRKVAEPIMDNILDGFRFDNYLMYSRDFVRYLKITGARTKFFKTARYMNRQLGPYLSREYIGSLHRGGTIIVLWKGTFEKSKDDILIKLTISRRGRRYKVTGVWLE